MHFSKEARLQVTNRILRYLKSALDNGILFKRNEGLSLEVHTNVDWAGSVVDHMSTFGYCTILRRNLVTRRSKKKVVVVRSNVEAEFRGMTQGICEVPCLKITLGDLGVK